MKMRPAEVGRRVIQTMHAWENSCPEQLFAEMTLEQFKQAQQPCLDAIAKFAAAETVWDATRQERNAACVKAMELILCVVNSVKGHPKYGENSAVNAAMGYVPKSDRSSGLTRRREAAPAKAPVEADEESEA